MTIKLLSDTFNKTQYNSVVTHPLQSWEWGEARKKMGIEIARIGEFEGILFVEDNIKWISLVKDNGDKTK